MPDMCTVSADDIRLVTQTMNLAIGFMRSMPGVEPVLEACGRLAAAADQAALPPCPVNAFEQMAIMDRFTLDAYLGQDFDRSEAFEILRILVAMRCNIASAAASRG